MQGASFAVAFFNHPNGFALYIFMALMAALGWWASSRASRVSKLLVVGSLALGLWWSFSKAGLVVAVLAATFYMLERILPSRSLLHLACWWLTACAAFTFWIASQLLPPALLNTFWWRTNLWGMAEEVIVTRPSILVFGDGLDVFALHAVYPQPHNLFLYILLDYGVLGLLLLCWIIIAIWRSGWSTRRQFGGRIPDSMQSGLWIALLGFFVVGLVESNLLGIEERMIFFSVLACYLGLRRESQRANDSSTPLRSSIVAPGPTKRSARANAEVAVGRPSAHSDNL